MRIVIDSNLWISSLISQQLRNRLEKILGNENVSILKLLYTF